jgi:hypothetical protein
MSIEQLITFEDSMLKYKIFYRFSIFLHKILFLKNLGSTLLCITNDEHWYVIVKEIISEALSNAMGKPTPITMIKITNCF